jgi:hypothetical protein
MKLQVCEHSKSAMIMVKRFFPIMILLLGVLFNLSHLAQAQQDSDIQQISPTDCQRWRDGAIITKTTHEEDIRDTLKSIATVNRTPITFGEGIDFKVTVQFKRTPLETAFESLINNYGLAYFWDGCSVHVFNPEMRTTKDVLIRLENFE